MNVLKILLSVFSLVLILCFNGCDSVIDPQGKSVSGKVYGFNHLEMANIKVSIENKTVLTNADGSFTFNDVTFPFDVKITDSLNLSAMIYEGMTSDNITLLMRPGGYIPEATINVELPPGILNTDLYGTIIFSDGNNLSAYINFTPASTQDQLNMAFRPPYPVTGKLFVLTFKKDSFGRIYSYENYGESNDIQITAGESYFHKFTASDISINPGEEQVEGVFNLPSGYNIDFSNFYITFSPKKSFDNSTYFGMENFGNNSFSITIPNGIPRQFYTFVLNGSSSYPTYSYEIFAVYPGTQNALEIKKGPGLISPSDEMKGVNKDTQFSFEAGSGEGVFVISLYNTSRPGQYTIIKSNNNFTLKEIEDITFGSISNNSFLWSVEKHGHANSVSDFGKDYFDDEASFILYSQNRRFLTAP